MIEIETIIKGEGIDRYICIHIYPFHGFDITVKCIAYLRYAMRTGERGVGGGEGE